MTLLCPLSHSAKPRSNGSAVRALTNGQTGGRTDGRCQVHYLPRFAVDNNHVVFCSRQLGFNSGWPTAEAYFGMGDGPVWIEGVMCNGSEKNIMSCKRSAGNGCTHQEDAGVICGNESLYISQAYTKKGVHQFRLFLPTMCTPNSIVVSSCIYAFLLKWDPMRTSRCDGVRVGFHFHN